MVTLRLSVQTSQEMLDNGTTSQQETTTVLAKASSMQVLRNLSRRNLWISPRVLLILVETTQR